MNSNGTTKFEIIYVGMIFAITVFAIVMLNVDYRESVDYQTECIDDGGIPMGEICLSSDAVLWKR